MQITDGKLIWDFSGVKFECYGRATQYYGHILSAAKNGYMAFEFTYDQWLDLICLSFKPNRHSAPLTSDILKDLDPQVLRDCKKKLRENLNWSQMYEDIISMSTELGKSIPEDMKKKSPVQNVTG